MLLGFRSYRIQCSSITRKSSKSSNLSEARKILHSIIKLFKCDTLHLHAPQVNQKTDYRTSKRYLFISVIHCNYLFILHHFWDSMCLWIKSYMMLIVDYPKNHSIQQKPQKFLKPFNSNCDYLAHIVKRQNTVFSKEPLRDRVRQMRHSLPN